MSKEMFEIKILVNENKESDDKNQAGVNKKLNDIVEKKGNVNEQLNNLLYQLTNAEVVIEENNRNTLTQVTKLKKFQSQLSDDFRNVQFYNKNIFIFFSLQQTVQCVGEADGRLHHGDEEENHRG